MAGDEAAVEERLERSAPFGEMRRGRAPLGFERSEIAEAVVERIAAICRQLRGFARRRALGAQPVEIGLRRPRGAHGLCWRQGRPPG